MYSIVFPNFKETKTWERERGCSRFRFLKPNERECDFSLRLLAIRSSKFVGTRTKVAPRSEAYAWAPILRSFDKLCEVGDLSYLVLHFV